MIQNDEIVKYPYSLDFGLEVPQQDRIGWLLIKTSTSDPIPKFDNDGRSRVHNVTKYLAGIFH